jgi:hypothetical protein
MWEVPVVVPVLEKEVGVVGEMVLASIMVVAQWRGGAASQVQSSAPQPLPCESKKLRVREPSPADQAVVQGAEVEAVVVPVMMCMLASSASVAPSVGQLPLSPQTVG